MTGSWMIEGVLPLYTELLYRLSLGFSLSPATHWCTHRRCTRIRFAKFVGDFLDPCLATPTPSPRSFLPSLKVQLLQLGCLTLILLFRYCLVRHLRNTAKSGGRQMKSFQCSMGGWYQTVEDPIKYVSSVQHVDKPDKVYRSMLPLSLKTTFRSFSTSLPGFQSAPVSPDTLSPLSPTHSGSCHAFPTTAVVVVLTLQ